jgi:hypothetical protein
VAVRAPGTSGGHDFLSIFRQYPGIGTPEAELDRYLFLRLCSFRALIGVTEAKIRRFHREDVSGRVISHPHVADLKFDAHSLPGVCILWHESRRGIRRFLIFGKLTYRQRQLKELIFFHPDDSLPSRTTSGNIKGPLPRFADGIRRYRIYKSQVNTLIFSQS